MRRGRRVDLAQFFDGDPEGRALFDAVAAAIAEIGACDLSITVSQIAFRRRRSFAFVWRPDRYVRSDVPAVLSIALPQRVPSDRFKEVAHPSPAVWMHHLELRAVADLDDEVRDWLATAYRSAA